MFLSFCAMFLSEYRIASFSEPLELFSVLNFVFDKDVEDLRSFGIIGFESYFEIFRPSRQGS